jgi:hypothetical protein
MSASLGASFGRDVWCASAEAARHRLPVAFRAAARRFQPRRSLSKNGLRHMPPTLRRRGAAPLRSVREIPNGRGDLGSIDDLADSWASKQAADRPGVRPGVIGTGSGLFRHSTPRRSRFSGTRKCGTALRLIAPEVRESTPSWARIDRRPRSWRTGRWQRCHTGSAPHRKRQPPTSGC